MATSKSEKPIDRKKLVPKICSWKPKPSQVIVEPDGKLFICNFDKILPEYKDKVTPYKTFIIGKESYINQLDIISNYTNFFINNYDLDNELVMGYLHVKFSIDKNHLYTQENMNAYIDYLYSVLFTPTMVDKIVQMVEDNYLDDIESDNDEEEIPGKRKKYVKSNKKHLESLEFNNEHIKILLAISFGMKIMSPCMFHYIQMNNIKLEKDSDIIFRFYQRLFLLFGYGNTYNLYNNDNKVIKNNIEFSEIEERIKNNEVSPDPIMMGTEKRYYVSKKDTNESYYAKVKINMYNKLYVYVKAKVLESNASNQTIFAQRELFGVDIFTVVNQFTKKVLISENIVKYKFNQHWDKRILSRFTFLTAGNSRLNLIY